MLTTYLIKGDIFFKAEYFIQEKDDDYIFGNYTEIDIYNILGVVKLDHSQRTDEIFFEFNRLLIVDKNNLEENFDVSDPWLYQVPKPKPIKTVTPKSVSPKAYDFMITEDTTSSLNEKILSEEIT